ncbi:uncharacterized protein TM35_000831000 [Trypanosoma theileri]|uniref:Uncharacterized protein n=1 Tax=Trypanosoma theileri TaxID=67003 RepID=A0A1X0NF43_9TRYP|nr:uncharacterized protein TM35_000831000 [Trypanosoma theileri]ORC82799.1 hypothetical protein TM35_000831000 [Trypanosoma theileri]
MTTMFIQLRRVVYLLVLLQCCVCVVNATSVSGGLSPKNVSTDSKVDILTANVLALSKEASQTVNAAKNAQKECRAAVKGAADSVKECVDFLNEIEGYLKNVTEAIKYVNNVSDDIIMKPSHAATSAAAKARSEAAKTHKVATDSIDAARKLREKAAELQKLVDEYSNSLDVSSPTSPGFFSSYERIRLGYSTAETAVQTAMNLESVAKATKEVAVEADNQSEEAIKAVQRLDTVVNALRSVVAEGKKALAEEQLQRSMEPVTSKELQLKEETKGGENAMRKTISNKLETKLIPHVQQEQPKVRAQQVREKEELKSIHSENGENKVTNRASETGENEPPMQSSIKEKVKNIESKITRTNMGENNTRYLTTKSQLVQGEKVRQNNKKNTNRKEVKTENNSNKESLENQETKTNTQKLNQIPTASTANEQIRSQKMSYGSLSTGSIPLDALGSNDNSNSPALLHGPLLLLLLCVLGGALVC